MHRFSVCTCCNAPRPKEYFQTINEKTGRRGKTSICKICIAEGMTPALTKMKRDKTFCSMCKQERVKLDFLGSQFEGDPYTSKTKVCRYCREQFVRLEEKFFKLAGTMICPVCNRSNGGVFNNVLDSKIKAMRDL